MTLTARAFAGLAQLTAVMGLALFLSAGTLRWPEAWVLLGVFLAVSVAMTLDLLRRDRALLERRLRAGPIHERRPRQKIIQLLASLAYLALLVVPGLDRRSGGSRVPLAVVALGELLVAAGFLVVFRVFRANSYAASTVEVGAEQKVIDSGPYAYVRHPMYAGALVMLAGVPLALGSWWGLLTLIPFVAVIVWRLVDEEAALDEELPGYHEYRQRTRHRLIPRLW
jgi:protein-S-isoprenylcysteine O-methyltransferase Ste14